MVRQRVRGGEGWGVMCSQAGVPISPDHHGRGPARGKCPAGRHPGWAPAGTRPGGARPPWRSVPRRSASLAGRRRSVTCAASSTPPPRRERPREAASLPWENSSTAKTPSPPIDSRSYPRTSRSDRAVWRGLPAFSVQRSATARSSALIGEPPGRAPQQTTRHEDDLVVAGARRTTCRPHRTAPHGARSHRRAAATAQPGPPAPPVRGVPAGVRPDGRMPRDVSRLKNAPLAS